MKLLLLIIIVLSVSITSCRKIASPTKVVTNIVKAVPVLSDTVEVLSLLKNIVDRMRDEESFEDFVFRKMDDITMELDELKESVKNIDINTIAKMIQNLPERLRFDNQLRDIMSFQSFIDIHFNRLEKYIMHWERINNSTKRDFCHTIISNNIQSVTYLIDRIIQNLKPTNTELGNTGILNNLPKDFYIDIMHKMQQSPQQIILNFYKSIALTQIKGYVLIQFAYRTLEMFGEGTFEAEKLIAEEEYKSKINGIIKVFKDTINSASSEYWRNDPDQHKRDETYIDIVRLAQAIPLHIKTLTDNQKCFGQCEDITNAKKINCENDQFCKDMNCNSAVQCQTMAWTSQICTDHINSTKRFNYIKNGDQIWGHPSSYCHEKRELNGHIEIFNGWTCPYCLCTCTAPATAVLQPEVNINLRPVMANVTERRVVTGVRFVKMNNIIHLQIQEGKLLPYGNIKDAHWVDVDNYTTTNPSIRKNRDYHSLTWDSRAIDLDDLIAPPGYVVTGVKFSVDRKSRKHIKLEIIVSPFDYKMGVLIEPKSASKNISNPSTPYSRRNPRMQLKLQYPDVPILTKTPSQVDSWPNQYIKFQPSDLVKDASQTTVPYFDSQPVTLSKAVPLQGLGIFHKGQKGYGGFIALKIVTYNVSDNLEDVFFPDVSLDNSTTLKRNLLN